MNVGSDMQRLKELLSTENTVVQRKQKGNNMKDSQL